MEDRKAEIIKHRQECNVIYSGPIGRGSRANRQAPLSSEGARRVALEAWTNQGRVRPTEHFRKRATERGFTTLDVEQVIRHGKPKSGPDLCAEFDNYKYCFRGRIDGVTLEVTFALDATQDYESNPLAILITGVWKTATGKRWK